MQKGRHFVVACNYFLLSDMNRTDELRNLSVAFGPSLEECNKDNTPEIKSRVIDIKNLLKS
jgi:hypothetical protein